MGGGQCDKGQSTMRINSENTLQADASPMSLMVGGEPFGTEDTVNANGVSCILCVHVFVCALMINFVCVCG